MTENSWDHAKMPKSITPSGFFGQSSENIVELKDFMTIEEQNILIDFSLNNKIWDITESHVDEDGLVLYDHKIWENRVCTFNSLKQGNPEVLDLIYSLMNRLKLKVDAFFNVDAEPTGPAIVRWPVGTRQEPHADKEFWVGEEMGRPNDFPWYDIAGLFYFSDDYEGGELYFPQHGIEFKPKPRAAYFFPGDRFYAHGVRPITKGNRFTSPFFFTIKKHTGDKQPPSGYVGGFENPEYKKIIEKERNKND